VYVSPFFVTSFFAPKIFFAKASLSSIKFCSVAEETFFVSLSIIVGETVISFLFKKVTRLFTTSSESLSDIEVGNVQITVRFITINNESKITFIGKRFTSTSLLIH